MSKFTIPIFVITNVLFIPTLATADRVIDFESGNLLETVPNVTTSWERISGSELNYPAGIGVRISDYQANSGSYSANLISNWQETNGEVVYRIQAQTTSISFFHLLGVGTTDGHQGNYAFYIDGNAFLFDQVPGLLISSGGSGWTQYTVENLTNTEHTFEWILEDKDLYTGSYWFIDDITIDSGNCQ